MGAANQTACMADGFFRESLKAKVDQWDLRKRIMEYRPGINTLPEAEATTANERIIIRCPGCAKKLKARRSDIGKKARCSTCETKFRIRINETDGETDGREQSHSSEDTAHASEDPGATILGLPREADRHHRDGERIAIGGDWASELGWGHDRVVVELDPDLKTLLTNGTDRKSVV